MSGCIKVQIGVGGSSIKEMSSNEDDEYRPVYISGEEIDFVGIVDRVLASCPNCDQLRTALDNMTEVARLAQEAAATAETRAVTRCAEICDTQPPDAATLIRKEYDLEP